MCTYICVCVCVCMCMCVCSGFFEGETMGISPPRSCDDVTPGSYETMVM